MSKVLLIYAHPDDETFGCGGTVAKYAAQGVEIVLVCATKGEAGKCGNPPVCTPENIGQVREKELLAAANILGIRKVIFLGYLDGQLTMVDEQEAIGKLVDLIVSEQPDVVVTFGPDGVSGHQDHITISNWATKAFFAAPFRPVKLYYNCVSPKVLAKLIKNEITESKPITTAIDVSNFVDTKMKAIQCHRTQNMSIGRMLSIPEAERKLFLSKETFHRAFPELISDEGDKLEKDFGI